MDSIKVKFSNKKTQDGVLRLTVLKLVVGENTNNGPKKRLKKYRTLGIALDTSLYYIYNMKKLVIHFTLMFVIICVVSCSQNKQTLPPPVKSVSEAKTLLAGKKWQVTSVATVIGSQESLFDNEPSKNAAELAMKAASLNWLSVKKDKNNSEFTASCCAKNLQVSISLDKDSIATTTGLEVSKQNYSIDYNKEENESKGIALFLTQKNEGSGLMSDGTFTSTYFILGANENKLYLLTPNKLNNLKVVYLLEAK
jgi:hypothetical protein